jgi:23S rRNA (uracil1939-C5)-methyltransferase
MPRHPHRAASDQGPAVVPGERLEVEVEKAVYRGLGLARHRGQVVFVPGGVPGDRHRVRVDSRAKGYLRAVSEELLAPGPDRRPAPCPVSGTCGGCAYQHLDYPAQLRVKEAVLRESLQRAGVAWEGEIAVTPSPEEGWRTRAEFHVEGSGDGLRLGLREEGGRRVVDLERCLQLSPAMNAAFRGLLEALRERPAWAAAVSDVAIAESGDGSRRVALLETRLTADEATRLSALLPGLPWLDGLAAAATRGSRRDFVELGGGPFVETEVLGHRLRSHVCSFFQANRFLVSELARSVLELTPPGGPVLDLYAGVGLFTIPLAARGPTRAVEASRVALEDARENAERAGLGASLRLHQGDAAEVLGRLRAEPEERIVLDPPRTGAGVAVVERVVARRPAAVVYVSCDPPTLGRDLRAFADRGYRPEVVRVLDLFPDTFHLETVVRLAAG